MDHVQPIAHGGENDTCSNLVTACWPCNAQKGEFTLDRLGWKLLPVTSDDWDGLVNAYQKLWEQGCSKATPADVRYHQAWIKAFFPPPTS